MNHLFLFLFFLCPSFAIGASASVAPKTLRSIVLKEGDVFDDETSDYNKHLPDADFAVHLHKGSSVESSLRNMGHIALYDGVVFDSKMAGHVKNNNIALHLHKGSSVEPSLRNIGYIVLYDGVVFDEKMAGHTKDSEVSVHLHKGSSVTHPFKENTAVFLEGVVVDKALAEKLAGLVVTIDIGETIYASLESAKLVILTPFAKIDRQYLPEEGKIVDLSRRNPKVEGKS